MWCGRLTADRPLAASCGFPGDFFPPFIAGFGAAGTQNSAKWALRAEDLVRNGRKGSAHMTVPLLS